MSDESILSSPQLFDRAVSILSTGEIEIAGQLIWGSNYTFFTHVISGDEKLPAVYKPARGEQPLWDFPRGSLAEREVAAYLTSTALGCDFVPPTVLRSDGPAGPGSLQLFIDADPERHYFTFNESEKQRLRPVVVYDFLINNADRKGGHVLLDEENHLWLIDHGLSFHSEYKLRTVVWDFIDEEIPLELMEAVETLSAALADYSSYRQKMDGLLDHTEIDALCQRAAWLMEHGRFPRPGPGRPYPWPLV